jgi:hypothetical protein
LIPLEARAGPQKRVLVGDALVALAQGVVSLQHLHIYQLVRLEQLVIHHLHLLSQTLAFESKVRARPNQVLVVTRRIGRLAIFSLFFHIL